jgi:hypothetical protein
MPDPLQAQLDRVDQGVRVAAGARLAVAERGEFEPLQVLGNAVNAEPSPVQVGAGQLKREGPALKFPGKPDQLAELRAVRRLVRGEPSGEQVDGLRRRHAFDLDSRVALGRARAVQGRHDNVTLASLRHPDVCQPLVGAIVEYQQPPSRRARQVGEHTLSQARRICRLGGVLAAQVAEDPREGRRQRFLAFCVCPEDDVVQVGPFQQVPDGQAGLPDAGQAS